MHRHELSARLIHLFYLHRIRLIKNIIQPPSEPTSGGPLAKWLETGRLETASMTAYFRSRACGRVVLNRIKSSF